MISLSKAGIPYENASCEVFFSSLKTEGQELRKTKLFEEIE
jgi:transposase InsO family protein